MTYKLSRELQATRTVLLADSAVNDDSQLAFELRNRGYQVKVAQSLSGSVAALSHEPQFVLLELRFGATDSLDLIATIRQRNPGCRIIVHTWFADVKAAVAVVKAGADDLLPKPMDADFVADILIGERSAEAQGKAAVPELSRIARTHIEEVLRASNGNVSLASKRLFLDRRSLQRIMHRYRNTRDLGTT
jgi:two-component system response regulator RegA